MSSLPRPARRALRRIAWRDARNNRWRTALVIAMIAIPVAGLVAASIAIATGTATPEQRITGEMGAADFVVRDLPTPLDNLPPGTGVTVVRSVSSFTVVAGNGIYTQLEDADPDDAIITGRYRMIDGRKPTAVGEVALSPDVLAGFGVGIGDRVTFDGLDLDVVVTGIVVRPEQTYLSTGLVTPATIDALDPSLVESVSTYLAAAPGEENAVLDAVVAAGGDPYGRIVLERTGDLSSYFTSIGIAVLALAETGLIAAAAFVVGTRRQLHALGLVGAVGGEARQVRAVVLYGGFTLGLIGSAVGAVVGLVIGLSLVPSLDRMTNRVIDGPVLPIPMIVAAAVLGTVAAVAAAWLPARTVARIPIVDALARRSPRPSPPGRRAIAGLLVVVVGAVLVAWGTITHTMALLTLGAVGMLGGILLTIPLLVTMVGRLASRLPLPLRIAARDTGRHGRRTAAAVAAATLALALPVAVSALLLSDEAKSNAVAGLAPDQLIVFLGADNGSDSVASRLATAQRAIDVVASSVDVVAAAPMATTGYDPDRFPVAGEDWDVEMFTVYAYGAEQRLAGGETMPYTAYLTIADDGLLEALHAEHMADALAAGKLVAPGSGLTVDGTMSIELPPSDPNDPFVITPLPAAESGGPTYLSLPYVLVSPERATELGLRPNGVAEVVIRTAEPLRGAVLAAAREAVSVIPGAHAYALADAELESGLFQNVILGFAAAIGLAIVGVAVALVAVESRRDQAMLVAVGAGPSMRRRIVASNALLLAGLAGVLAVPAGLFPVAVLQLSRQAGYSVIMPWLSIGVVLIVVPVIGALVTGAVVRRPLPSHLLRPQD